LLGSRDRKTDEAVTRLPAVDDDQNVFALFPGVDTSTTTWCGALERLGSAVGRVVWCDPHAAAAGWDPQVQGMQVALPLVDDHLDFSSVASLATLVDRLASPSRSPRERTHV
jgi:hypothetical protein